MRMESAKAVHNGGWLHSLKDTPLPRPLPPPKVVNLVNSEVDFAAMHAAWAAEGRWGQLCDHAEALGVSALSLLRLGAVWAPQHAAWAFPMRDGEGAIIGIRLRAEDGRKWAVRGSRAGLIYDPDLAGDGALLICEGPTDTAAAMTLKFPAVGRPSCRGQEDLLKRLLRRHRSDVVIVADNDPPKADGARPGLAGALALAKTLASPLRIILPCGKDIREWVRKGATRADIEALIGEALWVNVK
jgi:hypothetical protein